MIWQLANVVSVMEKHYGFKALMRSKELIKGKMKTAFAILLVINLFALPIMKLIEHLNGFRLGQKIGLGIVCLVLWALFSLFGLVVHTIFYLVCKSYHHENIDKSLLADHLEAVYLGEYVPLKAEVQLENL
ncbi:uncharacterized protein LOC130821565 [Amaranthus tricolor]|uniref:uncharacterized protein LOC130821565 n=1 Tax=Amaranthus tricolor TaxID=29722 RepID=UPI00258CEDB0|nr:uncharacterized protein LOC130821565 [Amaranthus tricolor]